MVKTKWDWGYLVNMAESHTDDMTDALKRTLKGEKRREDRYDIDVSTGRTSDGEPTVRVEWDAGAQNLPATTWERGALPDGVDIVAMGTDHYDINGVRRDPTQLYVVLKDVSDE